MLLFLSCSVVVYMRMEADCIFFSRSRAEAYVDIGAVGETVNKVDVGLVCCDYGAYECTCQYLLRLTHSERLREMDRGDVTSAKSILRVVLRCCTSRHSTL